MAAETKQPTERTMLRTAGAIEALIESVDKLQKQVTALTEQVSIVSAKLSEKLDLDKD